jgi:hypothetical protein
MKDHASAARRRAKTTEAAAQKQLHIQGGKYFSH